ncbi:MAG TPA: hypothetical protein VLZ54_06960 [Arenibacter sp.]|nr:hypothetical protein [Arenibacter sp.]
MNIKTEYMLEAGLPILHYETVQWMEDVTFYLDEFFTFKTLIDRKKYHNYIEQQVHNDIHRLVLVNIGRLQSILKELSLHGEYLSDLMGEKKGAGPNIYREKHKAMVDKINKLITDIRTLKIEVYAFLVLKRHKQRHGFPI